MRAALLTAYQQRLEIAEVEDPVPADGGVVLRVEASGVCRSDWHAWMGHEPLPGFPHVLGHEMAGVVETVGPGVERWHPGDRVTVPFSMGCGECLPCMEGHLNICDAGVTPGFTTWGSFAELVAIDFADRNLAHLPADLASTHAAALGCRFITSFRAVVDRGRVHPGEWLAVHGCGGVGLSAVMIGAAMGARVVAIDPNPKALDLARDLGAEVCVDSVQDHPVNAVVEATGGGAHVSIEAVGDPAIAADSIRSVRKQGRHVQVGLLLGDHARSPMPMGRVIMGEIEVVGSRGMPATDYPRVFQLMESGALDPARLVTRTVALDEVDPVLEGMGRFAGVGVTVIDRF